MRIHKVRNIAPSEITPHNVYLRRRELMAGTAAIALAGAIPRRAGWAAPLLAVKSPLSTDEKLTSKKDILSYNNFYEFGTDKTDPASNAHTLKTAPWTVKIDGLVAKPADYALDDIFKSVTQEERIYRLRCVEGWSMVIPWIGQATERRIGEGGLLAKRRPTLMFNGYADQVANLYNGMDLKANY